MRWGAILAFALGLGLVFTLSATGQPPGGGKGGKGGKGGFGGQGGGFGTKMEPGQVMPKSFRLTAGTGKPHDVYFCESCGTTLWSRYHIVPGDCLFVRVGTLDTPEAVKPDVHIYTRSKLPWLSLPEGVPAFSSSYKLDEVWSAESKERLRRNRAAQA